MSESRFERQELRVLVGLLTGASGMLVLLWHTIHGQEPTGGEVALMVILFLHSTVSLMPRSRLDWLAAKLAPAIGPAVMALLDRIPFLRKKEGE